MSNDQAPKIQYNPNPPQFYEKQMDFGFLGKLFGSPSNARTNIAGVVACVLTIALATICIWGHDVESAKVIAPLLGVVLGYVFGKTGRV